ncbi:hypothetical protein BT69DRAFT_1276199 [Atractiella rhizophila]|nr:hypothetical protein BT69DRAFT_1276199 [Atractiella rhizophila]
MALVRSAVEMGKGRWVVDEEGIADDILGGLEGEEWREVIVASLEAWKARVAD